MERTAIRELDHVEKGSELEQEREMEVNCTDVEREYVRQIGIQRG